MKWLEKLLQLLYRSPIPVQSRHWAQIITNSFLLHVRPVKVLKAGLRWSYTFGLGGLALGALIILTISGILLMFYYVPSPEKAYQSMLLLQQEIPYGWLFRNVHRWAGHLMVVLVFLHMCRVFYTASYKEPRRLNWVVGVILLVITLLFSFTGYLLPWDQEAYWAIKIGTGIVGYFPLLGEKLALVLLGGSQIGDYALLRFYVLHIMVLPVLIFLFLGMHFYRLRKDGGISPPPGEEEEGYLPLQSTGEKAAPERKWALLGGKNGNYLRSPGLYVETATNLLPREVIAFWGLSAVLLVMGILFEAPLEDIANPAITPDPAKAPWYFLGFQELLHHFPPLIAGIVIPMLFFGLLILLPFYDRSPLRQFRDRQLQNLIFTGCLVILIILTIIGTFFRGPGWQFIFPWG